MGRGLVVPKIQGWGGNELFESVLRTLGLILKNHKVLFPKTNDNDNRGGWLFSISMSSTLKSRVLEN